MSYETANPNKGYDYPLPLKHSGMPEEEMARIRDMIGLFVDKIWFILGVTLIAFIGAVIFFYALPNQYVATTRLMIKKSPKEVFLQTQDFKDLMLMPEGQAGEQLMSTQRALIRSKQTMKKLVETMGMRAFGSEKQLLKTNIVELILTLLKRIEIESVRGTNLLDISVQLNDPVLAANVTNTLAEIYAEQYKTDSLAWSREFAERILTEKQKPELAAKSYQIFEEMLTGGKGNSVIVRLKNRRDRLQGAADDMSLNFKDNYPPMEAVKRKIKELDQLLEEETRKAVDDWIKFLDGQDLLSGVSVVEYAEVPRKPVGPKRVRGILLATLGGLAGAYGLVFLLYQLDPRIKTEEELMQQTGMVCLGIVPKLLRNEKADQYADLPPDVKDTIAYIRTAIRFSMPQDKSKVILMTSALRSEGKTTMASNLSASLASDGLRTVLLDADTRRPRVHQVFHLSKTPGLTNYLNNEVELSSILLSAGVPNLFVIPSGDHVPNPAELLSANKLRELVKVLRRDFDKVIIDTPPVLNIADGMILAPLADGVVLVINSEKTEKRIIRKINEQFQQIGEKVIGGIINYYDTSKHSYYLNVYLRHEAEYYQQPNVIKRGFSKFFKKSTPPKQPA